MSQTNAVSDIERAEHLNYADQKGVKRVSVFNDGVQANVATKENQTNGDQRTKLYSNGEDVEVQSPLPTDGDSIYAKDVDVTGSDIGTFTGAITDIFDDLDTAITSTGHSSPATLTIKLKRPINNDSIKFCSDVGDDFSNVKIILKDRGGTVLETIDDSSNSTKYTSNTYDYPLTPWCTMVVEFHTTDDIGINWALMEKSIDVHAILRSIKPNGIYTDIGATTGGNLKTALEEYDDATNPFLRANDPILSMSHGSNPLLSAIGHVNKFGENPLIDTATTPEDVWDVGGLWVPPTLPRIHDIVSSSANDSGATLSSGTATGGSTTTLIDTGATFVSDGVAIGDTALNDTNGDHGTVTAVTETTITGTWAHINDPSRTSVGFNTGDTYRVVNANSTGASIIHVIGLDADMLNEDEFIVTNGLTNVPTVNTYYRIYRMSVLGASGRTVTNVGNISATAQTDGTITAQINIGNGQTGMAIYSIPKGKTGYLTQVYADIVKDGGVATNASFTLRETPIANIDGAGSRTKHFFGLVQTGTTHYNHSFKPYRKILENTDIWVRVDSVGSNGTVVSAGFDIILINN